MSENKLVRLRLQNGRYEGIVSATEMPEIDVVHGGVVLGQATVLGDPDRDSAYRVSMDIPAKVLTEGVQVISFRSRRSGDILDRITLMSGALLDEDIRAELGLLREELEMLKRAFRRHCTETGQD